MIITGIEYEHDGRAVFMSTSRGRQCVTEDASNVMNIIMIADYLDIALGRNEFNIQQQKRIDYLESELIKLNGEASNVKN